MRTSIPAIPQERFHVGYDCELPPNIRSELEWPKREYSGAQNRLRSIQQREPDFI